MNARNLAIMIVVIVGFIFTTNSIEAMQINGQNKVAKKQKSSFLSSDKFAVGIKAGTLGIGPEVAFKVTNSFNLRTGFYWFSMPATANINGIAYQTNVGLSNLALFGDVDLGQITKGAFDLRLTFGGVLCNNRVPMVATIGDRVGIGDHSYTTGDLAGNKLTGSVNFQKAGFYIGTGFGDYFGDSRFSFIMDLGVVVSGRPGGEIRANTSYQKLDRDLAIEADRLTDNFLYRFWPVVSLGVSYHF